MPTSSFDTFFACTILVAAALIATAFLGTTMQTTIAGTENTNKDSYLKAAANYILTKPGLPVDWGKTDAVPFDFGLAANSANTPYELDIDKISRLNPQNSYALSPADLAVSAKLSNIALGISVSQLMRLNIVQLGNHTVGGDTAFTFTISAGIDSKPASASLRCYVAADSYLQQVNGAISDAGVSEVNVQIPTQQVNQALLIVFARASIDQRITSYAIYNFASASQESAPSSSSLSLTPQNYTLTYNDNLPGLSVQESFVFSYTYQQPLSLENGQAAIPKLIDHSPLILVVGGVNGSDFFQQWISYPQVPLQAGVDFEQSEQNMFSYIAIVDGVLYRLDLSLGDLPK